MEQCQRKNSCIIAYRISFLALFRALNDAVDIINQCPQTKDKLSSITPLMIEALLAHDEAEKYNEEPTTKLRW